MMKLISIASVILLSTCNASGQTPHTSQTNDLVKKDSISHPIHQASVGKLVFMKTATPIEQIQASDFLTIFDYPLAKEKTDLNMRVFLDNSLTNYLHLLAPEASADELINNGNYQFSFLVDGKLIYVENLNVGAGTAETKNQRTTFRIPLISSSNEDSWGRFLWNRFLANGGEDVLESGEHLLKIQIRPYLRPFLKRKQIITGNVIAEGQIKIKIPEIKIDPAQLHIQEIKPLKDWPISTAKFDTAKIQELKRKIATNAFQDVSSIVVIKDGQLLLEEYFNGASRETLHDTRSVGKSFASTLLGMAIDDGYIKSETQTLKDFYPLKHYQHNSPAKGNISLKSLMTMSSIFDGSDMNSESLGHEENMYPTKNWLSFALDLPIDKNKVAGKQWDYFTAGTIILGDIIHKSVPQGLQEYADKKLFQPLGISHYQWQFTPQNVANTAGGLQLRAIDYAKFGQLYQNKGKWNGQQLLSKAWVEKSLSHQIKIAEDEYYGYLFWNKSYRVNDQSYEVNYSAGNGGNRIYIFKSQPIVIIITARAYNTPKGQKQADKMMVEYLVPAVVR